MTEQDKPFDDGPKNRVANVAELVDLILDQWDLSTSAARKKQIESVQSLLKRVIYLWELEAAYKSWTDEVKLGDRHSFQNDELDDFYGETEHVSTDGTSSNGSYSVDYSEYADSSWTTENEEEDDE